jgi:hypothetical protein
MQSVRSRVVVASIFLVGGAGLSPIDAQGWLRLPHGGLGYMTDYTTSGFFSCQPRYYPGGLCQAAGNTLTLTTGTASLTLTFHGVADTLLAKVGPHGQRFELGTVEKTISGTGPFEFPFQRRVNSPFFRFNVGLQIGAPAPGSGGFQWGYMLRSRTVATPNCCRGGTYFDLPVGDAPGPPTYRGLTFSNADDPIFTVDEDPVALFATVSVAPEPGTLVLLGTGFVGLAGVVSRRLRRRQ